MNIYYKSRLSLALAPTFFVVAANADVRPSVSPRQDEVSLVTNSALEEPIKEGMFLRIESGKNGAAREISDLLDALPRRPIDEPELVDLDVYETTDPTALLYKLSIDLGPSDEIQFISGFSDHQSPIKDGLRIFGKTAKPFIQLMKSAYEKNKNLLSLSRQAESVTYTGRYITCIEPLTKKKARCDFRFFRTDPIKKQDELVLRTREGESLKNGFQATIESLTGGVANEISDYLDLNSPTSRSIDLQVDTAPGLGKVYKFNLKISGDQQFNAYLGFHGEEWFSINDGFQVTGSNAEPYFNLLEATHTKNPRLVSKIRQDGAITYRGRQLICYKSFDSGENDTTCTFKLVRTK